jgi:hypothetical protein
MMTENEIGKVVVGLDSSHKDDMLKYQAFPGKEIMLFFPKNNNFIKEGKHGNNIFSTKRL